MIVFCNNSNIYKAHCTSYNQTRHKCSSQYNTILKINNHYRTNCYYYQQGFSRRTISCFHFLLKAVSKYTYHNKHNFVRNANIRYYGFQCYNVNALFSSRLLVGSHFIFYIFIYIWIQIKVNLF